MNTDDEPNLLAALFGCASLILISIFYARLVRLGHRIGFKERTLSQREQWAILGARIFMSCVGVFGLFVCLFYWLRFRWHPAPGNSFRINEVVMGAFGVAFAAFGIWIAVRIFSRRERWAKWTAAGMLALLLLYALSYGPWMWLTVHCWQDISLIDGYGFYAPLYWVAAHDKPRWVFGPYNAYLLWWLRLGT
jgi:hypothetical protein